MVLYQPYDWDGKEETSRGVLGRCVAITDLADATSYEMALRGAHVNVRLEWDPRDGERFHDGAVNPSDQVVSMVLTCSHRSR